MTQDGLAKDRQVDDLRQQIRDLQKALRDEQSEKEQAVARERREKEELRQRLQREQEEKHDVQNDLDEARQQLEQMIVEKENVQRLLNEAQIEKANIVELLSDADAAIERYKEERENEVFKIPSHDIQLTDTELGRGSYGGEAQFRSSLIYMLQLAKAGLCLLGNRGWTDQHGSAWFELQLLDIFKYSWPIFACLGWLRLCIVI